jgi:CheY-like chemotaxis protein
MAVVLCVGTDELLMETRRLILEQAGHTVVPATNEPEVIHACTNNGIQVAVLGQMVEPEAKRRVFAAVRQHCPSAKVLSLYLRGSGRELPDADNWLEVPVDVPAALAEHVAQLANLALQSTSA